MLHHGAVTVNTDKNRLVEIPPSSREPPDVRLTNIQILLLKNFNGVVLELLRTAASENCHSCQFAHKRLKGANMTKVMLFCA